MSPRPRVADRAAIAPFYVMEVMRAAGERERAGGDVLHLEVGQPCTGAPAPVVEAAVEALRTTRLHYTDALGSRELRARIARWYHERYGVTVEAERIAVTTGASGACVLGFLAAFDVGARVAVAAPGYPCYRNMLSAFGCVVVDVPVDDDTRYHLTADLLDANGPFDGVIVASPSNPTGTMLDGGQLAELGRWCEQHGAWLIVDEIYHGITYEKPAPTVLAHVPDAIVVQSFSKYFSMTGWRAGWLVLPPELVTAVERLAQNLTVAPPTLSQIGALHVFDAIDQLDGHVARYRTNRSILMEGLEAAGLERFAPADGAFYLWADVSDFTADSQQLCARWLDELGVATTPGIDFDPARGRGFVRFSYAGETQDIRSATERLATWLRRHTAI